MSDLAYTLIRAACYPPVWAATAPLVLHRDRVPATGPVLLAPTHLSPYDVPCLMAVSPRHLDFLSVVEFERKPFVGRLFRAANCVFLDRGRQDPRAVRAAVDRLAAGRVVVVFPEGRIRPWAASAVHGKPFPPGVVSVARLGKASVVPCVALGTGALGRPAAWLPLRRTRYGVIFGEPLAHRPDLDARAADAELAARLAAAYVALYRELRAALPAGTVPSDPEG
ncbi:MAG: putative acyltransferase [Phycisphaerales bacterium]|nr:putative acyltransferase [Phycisphaerales bacterium]